MKTPRKLRGSVGRLSLVEAQTPIRMTCLSCGCPHGVILAIGKRGQGICPRCSLGIEHKDPGLDAAGFHEDVA
jgi:hypothetical protein